MFSDRLTASSGRAAPDGPVLDIHRLSEADFDALAVGTDDEGVSQRLASSELSHRRVTLRALLDEMATQPEIAGPLASLDEAWDVLVRAEAKEPRAAAAVIDYPLTGVWAMVLLRRLRGLRHDDAPLWVDAGGLHLLASTAAARAALPFRLTVPVRRGAVVLPTLGLARLPHRDPWEVAEVSVAAGEIRIVGRLGETSVRLEAMRADGPANGGTPAGSWVPAATVSAERDGVRLEAILDDVDPHRQVVLSALPAPLGAAGIERWHLIVDDAWKLLVRDHPSQARAIATTLRVVVPTAPGPRFLASSASSGDAFGAALISEPADATELAATLLHEVQHAKLSALQHLVDLVGVDRPADFYAPWRHDPRPLSGLLQGAYAFFGVTAFWRRHRHVATGAAASLAHFEYALWRAGVGRTLATLRACPEVTALGHRFLQGVAVTFDGWTTEPVPSGSLRLARAAAADHHAGWRLHHLVPSPMAVAALADAWAAGEAAPPSTGWDRPTVVADPAVRGIEARAVLARYQLADPSTAAGWRGPGDVGSRVRGAVRADLDWLTGNPAAAVAGFERALDDGDPADPHAWSGLGLTGFDLGDHAAAHALQQVPELVRAVHGELAATGRAPNRLGLARWIGAALAVAAPAQQHAQPGAAPAWAPRMSPPGQHLGGSSAAGVDGKSP